MNEHEELLGLLRERSFARRTVTLASGRKSDFFIDCKQSVLSARGHVLVGQLLASRIGGLDPSPRAIAGVELGGCPLASAVALVSNQRGNDLDAIYVRKTTKGHGSGRMLEGNSHLAEGTQVVVLEDVVTTGGSTIAAVEQLRKHGFVVSSVIAVVDRLEGGREAIEQAGLAFESLYTREDFIQP